MPVHNWVQNISRNQLAGKQWCCPKCSLRHQTTVMETKFRSNSGYWTIGFHNTIVWNWKNKRHCNTFGSSLNVTLKRNVAVFLGFVETSLCVSKESRHRVSFTAGPGLMVLTVSCVGVLICYTGVRWIWNLFEEFVIFQHALVKATTQKNIC